MYRGQESSIYVIGRSDAGNHETIRPWYSDFTIGKRPGTAAGLRFYGEVEFCTDDESGTRRTITLEAKMQVLEDKTAAIAVSGTGTLKVTQPADIRNNVQVSVTLTNTATLKYTTADATLGSGAAMTLGAGTKLWLNTATLSNTLNLPTEGTATIRIDGAKLSAGDHVIATVGTGATANVVLDPASTVLDGRKGSLRIEGGSLVFNVMSKGMILIVK